MFKYGRRSLDNLATVRSDLQDVAHMVMAYQVFDLAIICGWRGKEAQTQAFLLGNSSVEWPDSEHNALDLGGNPRSNALDFGPWLRLQSGKMGIPWNDTHAFAVLGGMFIAAGAATNVVIRYGGDWDMNGSTKNQVLMDWGHVEVTN